MTVLLRYYRVKLLDFYDLVPDSGRDLNVGHNIYRSTLNGTDHEADGVESVRSGGRFY